MKRTIRSVFFIFTMSLIAGMNACARADTPAPSHSPGQSTADGPRTLADVEQLAGFNVLEPDCLPAGVSLDSATYEDAPSPAVVLHFKLVHQQFGDMGRFFEIRQEPQAEAPVAALSCGETLEGCEVLQAGDVPVVYRLFAAGEGTSTESLEWFTDGFSFRLHRMAGEPNKIYREELLKVVSSLK